MSLKEVLEFFEKDHRTTLSKYRGRPWSVERDDHETAKISEYFGEHHTIVEGWRITDKVTGRLLASAFRGRPPSLEDQLDLDASLLGPLTVRWVYLPAEHQESQVGEAVYRSLDDVGEMVWKVSVSRANRMIWHWLCFLVRIADIASAVAKAGLKIGLAILAFSAIWLTIENQAPMVPQAVEWLFDLIGRAADPS